MTVVKTARRSCLTTTTGRWWATTTRSRRRGCRTCWRSSPRGTRGPTWWTRSTSSPRPRLARTRGQLLINFLEIPRLLKARNFLCLNLLEWMSGIIASRLYGCIKLSILLHLDIQIFFTLENPRDSKSLFVCGREHIYKYVHRADCLYQTNNLHWHSAMPYAEKASASKPATYYYLIFLIRCNIKLQYVRLFFYFFVASLCFRLFLNEHPP